VCVRHSRSQYLSVLIVHRVASRCQARGESVHRVCAALEEPVLVSLDCPWCGCVIICSSNISPKMLTLQDTHDHWTFTSQDPLEPLAAAKALPSMVAVVQDSFPERIRFPSLRTNSCSWSLHDPREERMRLLGALACRFLVFWHAVRDSIRAGQVLDM
jgi:hypothetical protein